MFVFHTSTTKIETTHTEMATTLSAAPSALAIRSLPSFPTTTTTTTTTTIIFDDDDHDNDGKEVKEVKEVREEEEEMHEFVVIYEGPPSPRQGDGDDDLGKNRQVMCLTLPPTGGGCASTRGGTTSYVSEDDLLASIAARIGWPASFLCISRPASSSHRSPPSPPPLLFFPTHSIATSDIATDDDDDDDVVVVIRLHHQHPPLRATIVPRLSSVRGGKGGFGTLLRGQSKQAGARTTVDFGACRDLSGRRLRHVNDEIKLRRWRELQQQAATAAGGGGGQGRGGRRRGDRGRARGAEDAQRHTQLAPRGPGVERARRIGQHEQGTTEGREAARERGEGVEGAGGPGQGGEGE